MRAHLRPDQIRETLLRHGVPGDSRLIGVKYSDVLTTLQVESMEPPPDLDPEVAPYVKPPYVRTLIVPTDILEMKPLPATTEPPPKPRLFPDGPKRLFAVPGSTRPPELPV